MKFSSETLEEAVNWLVCMAYGQPTPAQMKHFDAWLKASVLNQQAWAEVSALKGRMDSLPALLSKQALTAAQERRRTSRRRVLGTLALLGGSAAIGLPLLNQLNGWEVSNLAATHVTRKGEQQKVILADGTQLLLNTNTAIRTVESSQQLRIELIRGELLVDASKRRSAGGLQASSVHGDLYTKSAYFVLRELRTYTRLSVKNGLVEARPRWSATPRSCAAGEVVCFDTAGFVDPLASTIQDDAFAQGLVSGQHMQLTHLLAELARYKTGLLDWDESLAGLTVTGSFHVNDVNSTLEFLAQMLPLSITYLTPYWVRVKKSEEI